MKFEVRYEVCSHLADIDSSCRMQDLRAKLICFRRLAEQEERAAPRRIAEAKARLDIQKGKEVDLQEEYKHKSLSRDDLAVRLGVLKATDKGA